MLYTNTHLKSIDSDILEVKWWPKVYQVNATNEQINKQPEWTSHQELLNKIN